MSSHQSMTTRVVFDYEIAPDGTPISDEQVDITLQTPGTVSSPQVQIEPSKVRVTTDANGYWSAALISNASITPSNTVYSVRVLGRTYQIQVPTGAGPFQSSAITVSSPAVLPPTTTSLAGPLTVTGLLTANGGLTATGAISFPAASIPYADISGGPDDSLLLHKASNETVTGVKTFTTNPVLNAGALPESAVASLVTDLAAKALDAAVVHNTTNETVAGIKTFSTTDGLTAPNIKISGLTGSVVASRYVGATGGGPPTTGAHLVGDYAIDTVYGIVWICTVAATPGTFTAGPSSMIAARAYRNAAYNSAQPAVTTFPFDAETYDVGAFHAAGTFTVPIAGYYTISAALLWAAGANPYDIYIYKNGAVLSRGDATYGNAFNNSSTAIRDRFLLAASDAITIRYQTNAVVANTVGQTTNYCVVKFDGA